MVVKISYKYFMSLSTLGIFLILSLFILSGCGESYKEKQQKKEKERLELKQKQEALEKIERSKIEKEYGAVYFPPQSIGSRSFTYEIQKFFEINKERRVVIKAFLENIEKFGDEIVAEFLTPLGEQFYIDNMAVLFRLKVSVDKLDILLSRKRQDPIMGSVKYLMGPDFYIIATIDSSQGMRNYEFRGVADADEVDMSVDVSYSAIAYGTLIDLREIERKD